ncbi:MAG: four helix bundle protein [Candidatus Peribacteraceae bacterium]|nr:four helix bundle protein [Candidatus Peribacteraceae bacterium]
MEGIPNVQAGKIQSFTDLVAWREAHALSIAVYKMTKKFPKEELYGLVNQLRRASLSVSSNIAEGFSKRSQKEKIQFYSIALSSLREVQSQLLYARDVGLLTGEDFVPLTERAILVSKLLNGLIKKLSP